MLEYNFGGDFVKKVTIYTKGYCPYCKRAVGLLKKAGADFEEIDVVNDDDAYSKIKEQTGCQTVPQIFIGDEFIGGFDELNAIKTAGELDAKLGK